MNTFARALVLAAVALAPTSSLPPSVAFADAEDLHVIEIVVDGGYQPNRVHVRHGARVRLRFIRRDYTACTREIVFPGLGIRRTLPTGEPVLVDLPALPPGEHELRCGMNMIRGTIVVGRPGEDGDATASRVPRRAHPDRASRHG